MDDMMEFPNIKYNKKLLSYYKKAEAELVKKASYIFCSSENLSNKIKQRYDRSKNISVVNNGIAASFFNARPLSEAPSLKNYSTEKTNIFYIGTVAKWMDWDLIKASILRDSNLAYHFIGPCEVSMPETNGITFHGAFPHNQLSSLIKLADILVMPFVVNGLIESVNPVKLYEYIYSGKPSISVRYTESSYFSEFVYLYNGIDEYMELITKIKNKELQKNRDQSKALDFCMQNTWNNRAQSVLNNLLPASQ
jgi:teichuronic acid biosynthesis glycosyltransferase TuaH